MKHLQPQSMRQEALGPGVLLRRKRRGMPSKASTNTQAQSRLQKTPGLVWVLPAILSKVYQCLSLPSVPQESCEVARSETGISGEHLKS